VNGRFECAVAIPAHDGLPDVLDAVESALAQSHPAAEIVVVDDGSRDGTGEAVTRRFGDRVRLVTGRFGSAAAARNAAWRASRAPWVGFLDADDLWFPDKLAVAAERLHAAPAAGWFFSDGAFRTLEGQTVPSWIAGYGEIEPGYVGSPVAELIEVNFILTSSVVVRRDLLERLSGFREDMSHAEDLDLWIRLARSSPAAASGRALVRYQHRPGGLTRQVEARLLGTCALFERLAGDPSLDTLQRRAARHRSALARYKLAVHALRDGRPGEAWRHLPGAWLFPERALPVALAAAGSLVPAGLMNRLRRQHWATRPVVAPMGRHRRVVLRARPAPNGGM
jgi:hypothetical protein